MKKGSQINFCATSAAAGWGQIHLCHSSAGTFPPPTPLLLAAICLFTPKPEIFTFPFATSSSCNTLCMLTLPCVCVCVCTPAGRAWAILEAEVAH